MSNHLAIATVTATLQQILTPVVQGVVPGSEVTLNRPETQQNGAATPAALNLFLFQVQPNASLRNSDLPNRTSGGDIAQRPRSAWNLHYLLTFLGNESNLEPQRMLGATVRSLHSMSVLPRSEIRDVRQSATPDPENNPQPVRQYLEDTDLPEAVELVKFTPLEFNLEELSKLWSVFFQTPYALSIAYEGTVILIDGEEAPRAPLPVRQRDFSALPFSRPQIDRVQPDRIGAGQTLVLSGRNLSGESTAVRFGDELVERADLASETDHEIAVQLPETLRAGVQGVQVLPRPGLESNVLAFVLTPTITSPDPISVSRAEALTLGVSPPVGRRQRVAVLIDDQEIARQTNNEDLESIEQPQFDIPDDFPLGTHLLRVRVDGAESPLQVDPDGQYNGPNINVTEEPPPIP